MTKDLALTGTVDVSKPRDPVAEIKSMMQDLLHADLTDAQFKRFVFETDETLQAAGLTTAEIRRVREWEKPRKDIAFGMQAAHERVTAMQRRETEGPRTNLHIETLTLHLPAKNERPAQDVTYVDVEEQDE